MVTVKIKLLNKKAKVPKYAHSGDSGLDLFSVENKLLLPGESTLIHTGLMIELPTGFEAQIRTRSGLALRHKIIVLNSPGTIDNNYRGEINIILINHGKKEYFVKEGSKIAQMVITPVWIAHIVKVDDLSSTNRGEKGFGSSG